LISIVFVVYNITTTLKYKCYKNYNCNTKTTKLKFVKRKREKKRKKERKREKNKKEREKKREKN
jgi:hypothetical protein